MRLSVWEALNYGAEHIIGEKERRSFWQMAVEEIRREQAAGKINHEMDADFLQLCLFALVAFPIVLPQMTKLITGHAPDDPKFLRRQKSSYANSASCFIQMMKDKRICVCTL
jgi:hypothetical protein